MGQQVYKELYEVMKNRRGPYTGVEIPEFYALVEELFTPQEAGLVHMSRNTTQNVNFICNCDRWHCETIKSVLKQSKPDYPIPPRDSKELITSIKASFAKQA